MRPILVAASVSLVVSLVFTPLLIRHFRTHGFGQLIRDDGPQAHLAKRGTPTMGGVAIVVSALAGYLVATLVLGPRYSPGGLLAMATFVAMGVVGFLDDFIKLRRQRSLGLTKTAKFSGQAVVAVAFAFWAEYVAETATSLSRASMAFPSSTDLAASAIPSARVRAREATTSAPAAFKRAISR